MPLTPIRSTLIHKIRLPFEFGSGRHPALILLHGRGTDEEDLLKLADRFDPRFFIASVRAPYGYGADAGGYTWYDIAGAFTPHSLQFGESLGRLEQFVLDAKKHYPVDERQVFLFGFSMGAILSYALALAKPEMVRGIVAHSGYIPENLNLKFVWDRLQSLSIFVAHGAGDPVVPVYHAHRARELLGRTGADLTYREYPIPHAISGQSLSDLSDWLGKKLTVR